MGRKKKRIRNIAETSLVPAVIEENRAQLVANAGLGGGINPIGFPFNQGTGWSAQISQPTTEFVNLRWYLVSNMRQLLSELYVEIGLVQTIVDVPVDDALRGGVEIKSKQLSEEQIADLIVSLDRDDDLNTAGQAAKWNRLFGGAGILVLTDQDPEEPLDLDAIDKDTPVEFRAVDMWELFWDKQTSEGYDPAIQSEDFDFYNYYGEQVHKSRVMRLKGLSAPSFIRPRLRGWGFSVVEALVRSLNQYLKATTLSFEVLDEFKVDVYKIKNLVNTLLSPQASQKVNERIQQTNYHKNFQNAIVMDSEDDWDHKQLSFAGLAEAMEGIRVQVASDMRMPMIKLFGVAASGMNANDESGIEVYNSMVESQVRNKIKYDILRICEIKCQKLFGFVPDDMSLEFKPLRVMSAEQEQNVKTQKFNRLSQAMAGGQLSIQEFRDACNKGSLFDITLDTASDDMGGYMDNTVKEGENDPDNPQDTDNPGADRLDTRKSRATESGGAGKEPPAPKSKGEPRNIAKFTKNSDKWEESKHPRDDDGKFGEGGGGSSSSAYKEKLKKQVSGAKYYSHGTEDEAKKVARELRVDGIHATIWHMEGPKTGPKSVYAVAVPDKDEDGGGKTSKGKDKGSQKGEQSAFKALKEPERQNSKTPDVDDICVGGRLEGGRGDSGKRSDIPYKSPESSTCNLVGYVALGKSSQKMQKHFTEMIQCAEVVLSEMGVKFKTPLDFVSQNVSSQKITQAEFKNYGTRANDRVNIKGKGHFYAKSILHEIGHAIDYKMNDESRDSASAKHKYGVDEDTGLKKLHKDLSDIVTSSQFYADAPTGKFKRYLNIPTEIFARGFEVYSYTKGLELVAEGKIPQSFIDGFRPDIFKTKDQKMTEVLAITNEAIEKANAVMSRIKHSIDETEKTELREKWIALKQRAVESEKEYEEIKDEIGGSGLIPEEKQQEYMDKITAIMSEIFKKDPVKNAIMNLELRNSSAFDRASYEADGGDAWIDDRRKYFFESPNGVDESLWSRAKDASQAAFGKIKWQFVTWWYKKKGGEFH